MVRLCNRKEVSRPVFGKVLHSTLSPFRARGHGSPLTGHALQSILMTRSRPLISSDRKVVISFSPKAGCTQVALWFFLQEGLLQSASAYNEWPHRFRTRVYYSTSRYQERRKAFCAEGASDWSLIKVTRDPTQRMLSIFRHAVKTRFLDDVIKRKLRVDPQRSGLSLEQFGTVLAGRDLTTTGPMDPHVCHQFHPVWDLPFKQSFTINLDDVHFEVEINRVSATLGLHQVDFSQHAEFQRVRKIHHASDQALENEDLFTKPFHRAEIRRSFPKSQLLADPRVHALAQRLYGPDFARVRDGATDSHASGT